MLMDYKFLVLIALASCCFAAELKCPQDCKCRSYKLNKVYATCSKFPQDQKFQVEVNHLKILNAHHDNELVLNDRVFLDMNLDKLETIRITNSSLREIHSNAFHGLKNLRFLDVSNNDLKTLHPDTFILNKNLKQLDLNGNPIQLDSNKKYFLNSNSILELTLSNCSITHIPSGIFSSLRNLQYLDLSHNELTEINANTFERLINLENVQLGNNKISKIDKDAFEDMDELTVLSLKGNNIRTVEGLEIETLKELDVSNCKFELLMADTFAGFPDVYSLNLSGNSIREINKETFTELTSLRYLDLSYNNIRGPLDEFMFEFNHQLETMSFAGNKELIIFPGFAKEFSSLYNLDISSCGIKTLTSVSFKGMNYLDTLNISGNQIDHVQPETFSSLVHLTVLDLSRNNLHTLNMKILFNNRHLRKLFVSHNYFSVLPAILFSGTPALSWLDMSHNHIYRLWNISESFVMKNRNILSQLTYLNTSGNKLKSLHMHSFISMRALETLDISNNPISCTQDFSHVMQWLIGKKVVPNLEMGRNSESLSLIKNNIQWEEILNEMCPISLDTESKNVVYKTQSLVNKLKMRADRNKDIEELEKIIEITQNPREIDIPFSIHPINNESPVLLPLLMLIGALFCILIVGINFSIYAYCKTRSYLRSRTAYTPAPSLSGHFLVRKGGKNVYEKLYADCSEPAPIHSDQTAKAKIISMLGFPQNGLKNNSNV